MSDTADTLRQLTPETLRGAKLGLEKEGLRVTRDGSISQLRHPLALGAALTHPSITTDFSEALLELITPPSDGAPEALAALAETESFVHRQLGDELIWSASMPCRLGTDAEIPIACYGRSDAGMRKHIYRRGLSHRYGRMMQAIAGVHFNVSFAESLWPALQAAKGEAGDLRTFVDERYMSTLRNVQRYDWLQLYLFGASPASHIDFSGARHKLSRLDRETAFAPAATSLRMSDMGYTNRMPAGRAVFIDSNSLSAYAASLGRAVQTPHAPYEAIGVRVGGEHHQLNTHLLQIENEYYTSVRPKQVLHEGESPLTALTQRGIRYLELRSLDLNPFAPSGVSLEQLRFLEVFIHYCLLSESPTHDPQRARRYRDNLNRTAYAGRDTGLTLDRDGAQVRLYDWALTLFDDMQPVAELLDGAQQGDEYRSALAAQRRRVEQPALTPSARLLARMEETASSYTETVLELSQQHQADHLSRTLTPAREEYYAALSRQSLRQQARMERESRGVFLRQREDAMRVAHCDRSRTLQCACCRD
ncbi:MAG: glutamate--cysteine ligase [Candidatus Thiodiazotropha sp.]